MPTTIVTHAPLWLLLVLSTNPAIGGRDDQ